MLVVLQNRIVYSSRVCVNCPRYLMRAKDRNFSYVFILYHINRDLYASLPMRKSIIATLYIYPMNIANTYHLKI